MNKPLDLVLFGATGFTGRQAARYLNERGLTFGVFGRNAPKLEALEVDAESIVGDITDRAAVFAAVQRARVVASTAGPFTLLGQHVVDACVEHRVHYCDITGETSWARGVIDPHHERACAEGTRLIPFAGFDSAPADLGALVAARAAGGKLRELDAVYSLRGGLNGGTLATGLHLSEHGSLRELADPWLMAPARDDNRRVRDDENTEERDADRHRDPRSTAMIGGRRVAPFFMGPINRRVVMRSHLLCHEHAPPDADGAPQPLASYGPDFRYREWQDFGGPIATRLAHAGFALGLGALSTKLGRALARRLGPRSGEGPSDDVRSNGVTRTKFIGADADDAPILLDLHAPGDPGNEVTVRILCETALALLDPPHALGLGKPGTGGVLTPALALGEHLLMRLERTGGFQLRARTSQS